MKANSKGRAAVLMALYFWGSVITLPVQISIRSAQCGGQEPCNIDFAKAAVWSVLWPLSWGLNLTGQWPQAIAVAIALVLSVFLIGILLNRALSSQLARTYWREGLLTVGSLAISYLLLETGYRIYQYVTLPERLFRIVTVQRAVGPSTSDQYLYDPDVGYRYTPHFEGRRGYPWNSHWQTNSYGQVSQYDYPKNKPSKEFRIAVLGDSFTAGITNNVRWPELLQDDLNSSTQWKEKVGERFTRVINAAVDGYGIVQMAAMLRKHVMQFAPDLVVVNFIADDLLRRLRFTNIPYASKDYDNRINTYIQTNFLSRIDWFRPYPELAAALLQPLTGAQSALPLDARLILTQDPSLRFLTRKEAVEASAIAVRDILTSHVPDILFVHQPAFEELSNRPFSSWVGLVDDLKAAVPDLNVVDMTPRLQQRLIAGANLTGDSFKTAAIEAGSALQLDKNPELRSWFYVPADLHPSDHGVTIYAHEVGKYLIEQFVPNKPSNP